MSRLSGPAICCLGGALLFAGVSHAQRGGADWVTSGNDAQRSSWLRADGKISKESMQKPGFKFIWKVKFANEPKQLNALTPAVVMNSYIGYRGFRSYAFIGGSSDNLFALDSDLGKVEYTRHFDAGAPAAGATLACPGGMTSAMTRVAQAAMAGAPAGRGGGGGRGGAARSGVGEPGKGSVQLAAAEAAAAAAAGRGPADAGRRGGGFGGGRGGLNNSLFLLTGDGMLRQVYVANGVDAQPPVKFLPPGANATGLIVVDNVAYAATSNGCGGAANGVWALDLTSKEVTTWKSAGSVAGSTGASFGPDGTLFVTTTDGQLAALEAKTLKQKEAYAAGTGFTSSPVIFEYKDKTLAAAASKDGRIHLIDTAKPGAALFKSPVFPNVADFATGALTSWQDADGTRWILAPANGAIVAWKVVEQNGAPALQPGWVSRDMTAPLPPMVVNGVVFAVSSGEFRGGGDSLTAAQRAQRSGKAVLYALDSATGKELWSSGTTMTSFVHGGGLSGGGGQMYLGTYDGTLYAFGIAIEH